MKFYRVELVQEFKDSPTQFLDTSYAETYPQALEYALLDITQMADIRDIDSPWYYRIWVEYTGYDSFWDSERVMTLDWSGNTIPAALLHIGWHYEKDGGPPIMDKLHDCPICQEEDLRRLAQFNAENTQ